MRKLIIPSEIQSAIDQGAALALSVSGGKDGQAMSRAVVHYIRSTGRTNTMFLIHADLGRMEWAESIIQCEKLATELQLELHVVSRSAGGLMGRLYERMEKVKGRGIPFWPSSRERYCTSDEKRGPINKHLRGYGLIISVEGIRAEEGRERAKKQVCGIRAAITSKAYKGMIREYIGGKRLAFTWNAIHDWLLPDIWEAYTHTQNELELRRYLYKNGRINLALDGWSFHPAYVFGNERVSCRYCLPFGSENDLQVAARHDNDGLGMELISMEKESGFTFRPGKSLEEIILPILIKKNIMKKLTVIQTSREEVEAKWNGPLPKMYENLIFIECDSQGKIDWDNASIYSREELLELKNVTFLSLTAPKPQFRDLKFATDEDFNVWLEKTHAKRITFVDWGRDLTDFWVVPSGEIIHSNLQTDIWCGKFVNLETVKVGEPIEMWMDWNSGTDTENDWKRMKGLIVESVTENTFKK